MSPFPCNLGPWRPRRPPFSQFISAGSCGSPSCVLAKSPIDPRPESHLLSLGSEARSPLQQARVKICWGTHGLLPTMTSRARARSSMKWRRRERLTAQAHILGTSYEDGATAKPTPQGHWASDEPASLSLLG
ncbi:hypothetical protein BD309DRAFT_495254 [Dichomitus squalens]|nr:hypothetical protein BD309DRAFT_495254 [Dichomitus squalens]